jgi:hypothetical protein
MTFAAWLVCDAARLRPGQDSADLLTKLIQTPEFRRQWHDEKESSAKPVCRLSDSHQPSGICTFDGASGVPKSFNAAMKVRLRREVFALED